MFGNLYIQFTCAPDLLSFEIVRLETKGLYARVLLICATNSHVTELIWMKRIAYMKLE